MKATERLAVNTVSLIGYVAELAGFVCAVVGLTQTWKENADGRSFLPPRLNRARHWVRRKVRGPRHVTGTAQGTIARFETTAHGIAYKHKPLTTQMTTDERIAALVLNVDYVRGLALDAHRRVDALEDARPRELRELRRQLGSVQSSLTQQDREMATRGIPLAVFGIGLATCGLLLQAIGSALPPW